MTAARGATAERTEIGTRRVLLVDDDELILEVAQMCLEMLGGWHVTTAGSGREGLDRAAAEHPDAIVMDVMMPGMDGPTAAVALRQNPVTADIPIVLLTAKSRATELAELSALPIVGVLSKPFDPMTLPQTLATMLGWGWAARATAHPQRVR